MRRPVLGLVLLAFAATACSVEVSGAATPAATSSSAHAFPDPDRITAEDAFGDLTTWNPCSVVDPDAVPDSWTARLDVPVAFEYCALAVVTDGVTAEVQVGYLHESGPDEQRAGDRPGGLAVVPGEDLGDGACSRNIVFPDGVALQVRSWSSNPDHAGAMCGISDEMVEHVIDAVVAGRSEELTLPENTIGELDPCDVVTPEMAAAVPGITAGVAAERQLSGHSCWWVSQEGTLLNVEFEIGRLPVGDTGETTHGRYTARTLYADDAENSTCAVVGEHVPFEHDSATGLMERAGVYVYLLPGQGEAACTAAATVADALWQELPPL